MSNTYRKNKNLILWLTLFAIVLSIGVAFQWQTAEANPAVIRTPSSCQTSTSTSSPAYLWLPLAAPANGSSATSTLSCDLTQGSNEPAVKFVTIVGQFQGSSTLAQLKAKLLVSQDNQDFYPIALATTTQPTSITLLSSIRQWQGDFASSTVTGATNTMFFAFDIPVPTRYSRIEFTLGSSTNPGIRNGGVWAQYVIQNELR